MTDEQRDEHVKALLEHHAAQRRRESDRAEARQRGRLLIAEREKSLPADVRRESDRAEARQRGRLLIAEREKSLPADVPLHKRGFGVLEEGAS